MSETKNDTLAMKLSLTKETLRIIDDNQLAVLDEVVGGVQDSNCQGSCEGTGCNTTGLREDDGQLK